MATNSDPSNDPAGHRQEASRLGALRQVAPFLPLPLVFLLMASAFARVVGPFYLSYNYDPDYAYLFNGLNLAILQSPEHIDHPGTPLQLALALLIRLANLGSSAPETAVNVLAHAESYLGTASLLFVLLYAVAMAWVGVAVSNHMNNRWAGWVVQCTPFVLEGNFLLFLRVNPEPLLLLLSLLLLPFLLRLAAITETPRRRPLFLISFLVATGVCLKVTFLPVLLVVLALLPAMKARVWFAILVVGWCALWTLPIWSKYGALLRWFWSLVARRGWYGLGDSGMVDLELVLPWFLRLLWASKFFVLSILASTLVVALGLMDGATRKASRAQLRLLAILTAGQLLQIAMSIKNPQSRYLAPMMGLVASNWALVVGIAWRKTALLPVLRRRGLFVALAVAALVSVSVGFVGLYRDAAMNSTMKTELSEMTTGLRTGVRVYHYGASSPVYALAFGNAYSGSQYSRIIERLVKSPSLETYFFQGNGEFYSFRGKISIGDVLQNNVPNLFHGDRFSEAIQSLMPPGTQLVELRRFQEETVYELRSRQ